MLAHTELPRPSRECHRCFPTCSMNKRRLGKQNMGEQGPCNMASKLIDGQAAELCCMTRVRGKSKPWDFKHSVHVYVFVPSIPLTPPGHSVSCLAADSTYCRSRLRALWKEFREQSRRGRLIHVAVPFIN